ncbi:MAG: hypothetical protein GC138_03245 [Gammaproteobacteria bacterium]|nr:hypothetical protein [Gammaproteobacteria bacterium]
MDHSDQTIESLLQTGYRYALSLTHHHYEAEDLVQEAWMRLWSQKGKMPDQSLLFTAIRNLFIDRCRRANIVVFESVEEEALGPDRKTHVPGGALDLDIILAEYRQQLSRLSLAQRGEIPPDERLQLHEDLAFGHSEQRVEAARDLAAWGDRTSVPALIQAMQDGAGTRRPCQIAHALGRIGDPAALPVLQAALDHPSNTDLRACAAIAIGEIGDRSVMGMLIARINDPALSEQEQISAFFAVWDIADLASLHVLKRISDEHPSLSVREYAACAIRQMNCLLEAEPLTAMLNDLASGQPWAREDWIASQMARHWDATSARQLNAFLRGEVLLPRTMLPPLGAILTHYAAWEPETMHHLAGSPRPADRWLAQLAVESASAIDVS